jgi:hypothetical protein
MMFATLVRNLASASTLDEIEFLVLILENKAGERTLTLTDK